MRTIQQALIGVLAVGCASNQGFGDQLPPPPADNAPDTTGTSNTDPDTDPPEEERDLLLSPAQTDLYVFVASPERNTVTRIDVDDLRVDTTPVGSDPHVVLTTPDYATAVVFNRGDDSVSVLDTETLAQSVVPVRDNFNDMVLSPDGRFAVVWHNVLREREDDPPAEGMQSFNEVSIVDVATLAHAPMAVGFNPHMVRFTPGGELAVIVADAYLALVDLTVSPLVPRLIELVPGVVDPPSAEEVIVAEDGSFAWVRQFGADELLVVDLVDGSIAEVPGGVNPTDLDLSPDGNHAVAVARGSAELWVYDARQPFEAAEIVALPPSDYGSLTFAPTGEKAILSTNASPVESFGVWTVGTSIVIERSVVKPISSVAVSPTGDTALFFHTETDGPNTEPLFAGDWALTLVSLLDFRSNPLLLPAEPLGYAHSTGGTFGYFAMFGEPLLERLDYTSLLHDEIGLRSLPSFVGVLPDVALGDGDEPPAWVSQEYELGRISFYDPDEGSLETLTGFELNAEIEVEVD
jgi:DNA-binding beta-propeller fold protein YncE